MYNMYYTYNKHNTHNTHKKLTPDKKGLYNKSFLFIIQVKLIKALTLEKVIQ